MTNFAAARHNMVESQVRPNGITDHRIIDAMAQVKREDFVPAERKTIAYLDDDVQLKEGRFLIEPMAFARMIHLALIKPTDRVLVVGAGTGYGAKVISMLAKSAVALESDPELAGLAREFLAGVTNVEVVEGSLAAGHAAGAPYDVIIVEGRIAAVPESLFAQLANEGRIVAAAGNTDVSKMQIATLTEGHRSSRSAFDVSIAPLPGFTVEKAAFVF
ncbi:MAG TPA: protein-L-isoaspartate O-methyltransferase [Aestuariivirga sp.]|nr:protein-L-isoaspartate O-methyltransferase [Aestuariivirga sp.]